MFSLVFDSTELNLIKKISEEQIYEDTSKMKQEVLDEENEKKKMVYTAISLPLILLE